MHLNLGLANCYKMHESAQSTIFTERRKIRRGINGRSNERGEKRCRKENIFFSHPPQAARPRSFRWSSDRKHTSVVDRALKFPPRIRHPTRRDRRTPTNPLLPHTLRHSPPHQMSRSTPGVDGQPPFLTLPLETVTRRHCTPPPPSAIQPPCRHHT